jgi:hypothetical protein
MKLGEEEGRWGPWVELDEEAAACRKKLSGAGAESTGTGALVVLLVLAWVVFEADKRVPR